MFPLWLTLSITEHLNLKFWGKQRSVFLRKAVTIVRKKKPDSGPTYRRWWQRSCWLSRCCPREAPGWTGLQRRLGWCCAGRWRDGKQCTPDLCFWWTNHLKTARKPHHCIRTGQTQQQENHQCLKTSTAAWTNNSISNNMNNTKIISSENTKN